MFAVIGLLLRKQVVGITDDEIALGRRRCARRAATLRVRPWKRLVGRGTLLEIRSGPDVWRIGTTHRLPGLGGDTSGISPWKVDAVMSPLDFDEILSRLAVPEAPASIPGLRVDLVPFLRTFPSGFATSVAIPAFRPWPDPVKRRRAPRWTLDLDAAAQLLRVLRLSAAD
jgi:hypothetical protein